MPDVKIGVKENGNGLLLVKGEIELVDGDGTSFATDKPAIALCRCIASGNSPFGNGTHKQISDSRTVTFLSPKFNRC